MAAIPLVAQGKPRTYTPADNAAIKGGNGVAAAAAGRVAVSGADSEVFLGVALYDAIAPEDVVYTPDVSGQRAILNTAILPRQVAVATVGSEVPVTFAADTGFGALVKCAASGEFTPWLKASDKAETLVGRCVQPGGVDVSASATGLLRILR